MSIGLQGSGVDADPRVNFWSRQDDWPEDHDDYIFLANVVLQAGAGIYQGKWKGDEPALELPDQLPENYDSQISPRELNRGCRILWEAVDGYRLRGPSYAEYLQRWPVPTDLEWGLAVCEVSRRRTSALARLKLFWDICWGLRHSFKSGRIGTGLRKQRGGTITPMSRDFWNTEIFWHRFATCQVDENDMLSTNVIQNGGLFIFVERASLAAALKPKANTGEPASEIAEGIKARLSPYLKCMIDCSLAHIVDLDDPPKKVFLERELPKFWSGSPDNLTPTDISKMATLMRPPISKLGRGAISKRREG